MLALLYRLTIWTAVIMKDIEITDLGKDAAVKLTCVEHFLCSIFYCNTPIHKAEELRNITTTNVSWLLVAGWMSYFGSMLLNLAYYMMHPSSPEMCTWGAEEELEEWTPTGQRETERRQANNRNQPEASNIELTELLPTGSNGDFQTDDIDYIDDSV